MQSDEHILLTRYCLGCCVIHLPQISQVPEPEVVAEPWRTWQGEEEISEYYIGFVLNVFSSRCRVLRTMHI